ncbi:MAG: ATP-grasp domain-containing protein, partial [Ruminococcus sp.]|nr:ATP-grasp domain-containing protein [Ruminococcus sp.]
AVSSLEEAREVAEKAGYPVLVKASAGGGGRGIRRVDSPEELESQMESARREAKNYFGDDSVYIEKFLINPHHVEIQILADKHGNYVYLNERDCSMQRRNQKVLEECPSPIVSAELRKKMGQSAVTVAKQCGYYNAGTIEFLVDENRDFYFMEMNTRIQVEHPITEEVTGIDLVKAQIEIASGMPLKITQNDVKINGHAIECRINAENPELDFRPSPGTITALYMPGGPGIRIDGAVYQGYTITPYYDSMISKLIAHGSDRDDAIRKMKWALAEFIVEGVDTNIDFQLEIIRHPDFIDGNYDIGFLGRYMENHKKK